MPDEDYFFKRLIEQAKGDDPSQAKCVDRDDAISLLKEFVGQHASGAQIPEPLVAYMAECVAKWLESECMPAEAAKAFNVQRPAHRDTSGKHSQKIALKHIKALRTYHLMCGRRKGREEAICLAGKNAGLSESAVKKLLEKPASGGLTIEQGVALLVFRNKAVKARCLKPARKRYQRTRQ